MQVSGHAVFFDPVYGAGAVKGSIQLSGDIPGSLQGGKGRPVIGNRIGPQNRYLRLLKDGQTAGAGIAGAFGGGVAGQIFVVDAVAAFKPAGFVALRLQAEVQRMSLVDIEIEVDLVGIVAVGDLIFADIGAHQFPVAGIGDIEAVGILPEVGIAPIDGKAVIRGFAEYLVVNRLIEIRVGATDQRPGLKAIGNRKIALQGNLVEHGFTKAHLRFGAQIEVFK